MSNDSTLHRRLIETIVRVNPGAQACGFRDALPRRFIEAGEVRHLLSDGLVDDESFGSLRRALIRESAGRLPDAFALPKGAPVILLWEVCVTMPTSSCEEKWLDLMASVLDVTGNFKLGVIAVTAGGFCSVPVHFGFDPKMPVPTWNVEEPCPVVWERFGTLAEMQRPREAA